MAPKMCVLVPKICDKVQNIYGFFRMASIGPYLSVSQPVTLEQQPSHCMGQKVPWPLRLANKLDTELYSSPFWLHCTVCTALFVNVLSCTEKYYPLLVVMVETFRMSGCAVHASLNLAVNGCLNLSVYASLNLAVHSSPKSFSHSFHEQLDCQIYKAIKCEL